MTILASDLFPERLFPGDWDSEEMLTSGTFTVPTNVPLNANGKVDVYVTAAAAGGGGGGSSTGALTNPDTAHNGYEQQGGAAGQGTLRYKIEGTPGEDWTVTIPGPANGGAGATDPSSGSAGTNGGSLTIVDGSEVTLLTLVGGTAGAGRRIQSGFPSQAVKISTAGNIASGSIAGDNAIRNGASYGGSQRWVDGSINTTASDGMDGEANYAYQSAKGSRGLSAGYAGAGAGLFGSAPTTSGADATDNTGAGGAPGFSGSTSGGKGASGKVIFEWRIAE